MTEPPIDDLALLREMRAGGESAFGIFYERHQGQIFRFVLHMTGNEATAEEVTQEVFLLLINRPKAYDPTKGSLLAYLFGAARNLARRATGDGSGEVRLHVAEELDSAQVSDEGVLEILTTSEALDFLRKALLGLPEAYREVVVLCDLEEMSYEQAARVAECSAGTVASRLHRAHNMLRTKLSRMAAKDCQR